MVAVQRNFIEKYIILSGSFLTISNALKQFPVLKLITPEAHAQPVFIITTNIFGEIDIICLFQLLWPEKEVQAKLQ